MSDSGRTLGDCQHGNTREWCVRCLRTKVEEQNNEIEFLKNVLSDLRSGPLRAEVTAAFIRQAKRRFGMKGTQQ